MNDYILEITNLTKSYHKTPVLSHVSLSLERGHIYGLMGENGAGKTTLMRVIAGLSYPDEGHLSLFGHTGDKELCLERRRIGCMIESPALYPNMTARENLELYRTMKGLPDPSSTAALLDLARLYEQTHKKVKNYSLGMKQKLGIAAALTGNPELLILDEPINGLDPANIAEMRTLFKNLSQEKNICILISSHILSELYQLATDYIILHKGHILEQLPLQELNEKCRKHILLKTNRPPETAALLQNHLGTFNYLVMPDQSIKLYDYLDNMDIVAKVLYDHNIIVSQICLAGDSLENYYLNLTGGLHV